MSKPHDPLTVTLSTHILDTSKGTPGRNIKMSLQSMGKGLGDWKTLSEHTTNDDGRVGDFPTIEGGVYRLIFHVQDYFKKSDTPCFYPEVSVVFQVELGQHYHVPLLISPFGYSTYRGS